MSISQRVQEVAGSISGASKDQARRARVKLAVKRLESKVAAEERAIGRALFPRLASGELRSNSLDVDAHVGTISALMVEIERTRAAADAPAGETFAGGGRVEATPDPFSDPYRDSLGDGVITAEKVIDIQKDRQNEGEVAGP